MAGIGRLKGSGYKITMEAVIVPVGLELQYVDAGRRIVI